jgi:hypothetical protein
MILNLALMLALNAAAAPAADKPIVLKTLHSFPAGRADENYTVIATPTDTSVNLWSIETGLQLGQYDFPKADSPDVQDTKDVEIHAVRPDLKLMLISTRHLFHNSKYVQGGSLPSISRSIETLYLASTEDDKDIKKLWTFEGPCAYWGGSQSFECPGLQKRFFNAQIRSDREVVVEANVLYAGHLNGAAYRGTRALVFNLNGKKIFDNEFIETDHKVIKGTVKKYAPTDREPPLELKKDSQSCSVMRGGKRISFLTGCTDNDSPYLYEKLAASRNTAIFKVWDAESGALKVQIEAQIPTDWDAGSWNWTKEARFAWLLNKKSDQRQLQIWSMATGKLLAVGSGPDFDSIEYVHLFTDGRRALIKKNSRILLVDLGLEDAPAAAPSAPAVAKVDVDELPSGSSALDPDAYAVVIGIEKYRQAGVPVVDYASRDAKTMAAYLGTMGFDVKNVAVLTDAQAGKVDFDKYFGKWLKNRVGPKSRVFVYYAGHGAPNPTTGAGYLMPYEADPAYLEETAYPVTQLYAELAKLPTKDVTVVLDACFSGQGERSLIAKGTRPLVPVQAARGPENAAVIAAASGSQISASDHEARHGLLTYHLLAGLHGEADANKDGMITTAELFAYARPAVERAAKLQNVEQTPTVSGDTGAAGARVWTTLKKP